MQEEGEGDIVNLSSIAGRKAYAGSSGYNASKFGVTAFSEALREEVVDSDIRVTTIEPTPNSPNTSPTRTKRR